MKIEPIKLEGQHVRLEPLSMEHHARLCEVAFDADLWRWTSTALSTAEDVRKYIEIALCGLEEKTILPFATVEKAGGKVIGSTRFAHIAAKDRRVEIGWTWIARQWQRTAINTEAKYLMLRHAFETWGCNRVELLTNALNAKSRAAIERIGAKYEGLLRRHMVNPNGVVRDTVVYSVIDSEWEGVKRELERKMAC